MGRARNTQEGAELEKANAEAEEKANTGDEAVDAFLNGETDEVPEGAEEITKEEAEALEEKANAEAEEKIEDGEYIIEAPNKAYIIFFIFLPLPFQSSPIVQISFLHLQAGMPKHVQMAQLNQSLIMSQLA